MSARQLSSQAGAENDLTLVLVAAVLATWTVRSVPFAIWIPRGMSLQSVVLFHCGIRTLVTDFQRLL